MKPEKARALSGSSWRVQPKVDGQIALVVLDELGRVARILSRGLRPIRAARDLVGVYLGQPRALLCGEYEGHTEAGKRAAAERGYANLHLFDALEIGRDLDGGVEARRVAAAEAQVDHISSQVHRVGHGLHDGRDGRPAIVREDLKREDLRSPVYAYSPEAVRRRDALDGSGPLLEASGGINLDTVHGVAATGVDRISVGALTHSPKAPDISLLMEI